VIGVRVTRSIKVSSVGEKYQTTPGADCILPVTDLVGGQYFLELHQFSGLPIARRGWHAGRGVRRAAVQARSHQ